MKSLSFLTHHVEIDQKHNAENEEHLSELLSKYPQMVDPLIEAGTKALRYYIQIVDEVFQIAKTVDN